MATPAPNSKLRAAHRPPHLLEIREKPESERSASLNGSTALVKRAFVGDTRSPSAKPASLWCAGRQRMPKIVAKGDATIKPTYFFRYHACMLINIAHFQELGFRGHDLRRVV
jgi:hypothetical protein